MADGIADIDGWTGVPGFRGARRQQYFSVYQEGFLPNHQFHNSPDVLWETGSLSSQSGWNCDHEGPCCTCDCDCQLTTNANPSRSGYDNMLQNGPDHSRGTHLFDYRADHASSGHSKYRRKSKVQHNPPAGAGLPPHRQETPSIEDLIYYTAKQQRHLNDTQRRIRDWIRVMPELTGNSGVSATPKKCKCKDCKDDRKRAARKDKKKKKDK
ncbi:hypothetical protein FHETE_5493 [Fusarium heterosporum]|uniref:Uncharacterized protein n=1 Tax=Fusarium heterosporum TaxID=42747 RepID=A0A8H5WRT3_FUSHE|nr:hypothetical protein FHETE_5493 [Fusarium heterosporum]